MSSPGVSSEAVPRRIFWVEWFHSLPHTNLSLSPIDRSFEPFSTVYQESLGIIGSVPAAILILTLLVLLLYLLTRCCDHRPRNAGSIACLKATCVITSFLTLGALGVSIWGNEEVHVGIQKAIQSLNVVDNKIGSVTNMTKSFHDTIKRHLEPDLNLFRDTVEKQNIKNKTARIYLLENIRSIEGNISEVLVINVLDIKTKLNRAKFSGMVDTLNVAELGRWVARNVLTGILILIVLIVPIGVARHSRCTLITFSVLGLIALIICWSLTSVYLVLDVAISDCCMDPNEFLEEQLTHLVSRKVAAYYMRCDPTRISPFTGYLTRAKRAADAIEATLKDVTRVADEYYKDTEDQSRMYHLMLHVKNSQNELGGISGLLECQAVHQEYLNMLNAVCYQAITGFVYLLLSAAGSGFLFTILVWFTSHTWIYLNNKYQVPPSQWAEREKFLPERQNTNGSNSGGGFLGGQRPRHSHTPPQTPPFPGTLNGNVFHRSEVIGMVPTSCPVTVPLGSNGAPPPTSNSMPRNNHSHHHHGHHTHSHHATVGPNHGQYATLSKQCKTLESSDFY